MSAPKPSGTSHHIPILLDPITDFLVEGIRALSDSAEPGVILDCTLGGGGHTLCMIEKIKALPGSANFRVLGVDRDPDAIRRNQEKFAEEIRAGLLEIHYGSFSESMEFVQNRPIFGLLADLGVSSDQIDSDSRGFSFRFKAPLDMRMNPARGVPLSVWLESVSEAELADVIWRYGEERFSRKIARKIIDLRSKGALPSDTEALSNAIQSVFPPALRHQGIHPATRTFQALRIKINEELTELETLIGRVFPSVAKEGRLAILSFHSLEDRLVKEEFRKKDLYELPFKKPLQAGEEECRVNPRSRSAKLRMAIRK